MRWKWITGIIAAGVAVLVLAGYVLLSRYNFNNLKPQIIRTAKEVTGRELKLGGDSDLKGSLTVSLAGSRLLLSGELLSQKMNVRSLLADTPPSHGAGKLSGRVPPVLRYSAQSVLLQHC